MFETVKTLHEAFHTESPWLFATLIGVVGFFFFGASALIVDRAYQRSLKEKAPIEAAAAKSLDVPSGFTPTSLNLQFNEKNTIPSEGGNQNVWRWYAMGTVSRFPIPRTSKIMEGRAWTVFIAFDRPTTYRQIRVVGSGTLPRYEVKDSSYRTAVVVFYDDIVDRTVSIQLDQP